MPSATATPGAGTAPVGASWVVCAPMSPVHRPERRAPDPAPDRVPGRAPAPTRPRSSAGPFTGARAGRAARGAWRWFAATCPAGSAVSWAVGVALAGTAACARPHAAREAPLPASIPPVAGAMVAQYTMRYVDVALGTGAPAEPGQVYAVQYTGWLRDGTRFDSSRDRGEPIRFEQGKRRVIPGWDAGFEGMRVGGRRRLFIPYQLAYGVRGRGPIPPRAELIFDVELVGVSPAPAADSVRAR